LIPQGLRIDFVGKAKYFIALSVLLMLIGVGSIVVHGGFNQGVDFSGGTLLQLRFSQPPDLSTVREALGSLGFGRSVVQTFGDPREVLIRIAQLPVEGQDIGKHIQQVLQERSAGQPIELRRVEAVGAQASADLRRQALFALFYAILGIVVYLSGRFEAKWLVALGMAVALAAFTYAVTQWFPGISPTILIIVALVAWTVLGIVLQLRYALAAIVAIYHDVLMTVGFLSIFNKEFDLQILAALMTITGYSLYDTIVTFDRIRENMQGQRRENFPTVVNDSINQTLSRTILTSGTSLDLGQCGADHFL
jgi:preprotein translocase subunit SecF